MNDKLYGTIISIMIIWIFWTTSHLFGLFNDVIKDIESWDGYEVADVTITLFGFVLTLAFVAFIYKQIREQIYQQNYTEKFESARFLLDFKRQLAMDHKPLINTISSVVKENRDWTDEECNTHDDRSIRVFLNDFEMLAVGWKDGTWKTEHINQYMGTILMNVKNEKCRILPIMNKAHSDNANTYTLLPKLLKTINEERK